MTIKFATALATGDGGFAVGKQAAQKALSELGSVRVDLCLVFGSLSYGLEDVVKGIRSVVGSDSQILGSSSCGEFTDKTVSKNSVAVGLIHSDTYQFCVKAATGLREDVSAVLTKLGQELQDFIQTDGQSSILMMIDGLGGNGEEATLCASAVFGADVKIAGGAAGDELAFDKTWVIANDQVLTDAVSICVMKGPGTFFTGVQHGHKPLSEPLMVTRAEENVLYEVDGRSAWDVWKEKAGTRAKEFNIDVERFAGPSEEGAFLVRFELGLETGDGYKIRVPLSKNADGSLNFACTIPEGVRFRIMESIKSDQIQSAQEAAELAMQEAARNKVSGALVFDCVCRSLILEDQFKEGIHAIQKVIGDVPLLGFETYGEICMNPDQFSGFHNTTSVVVLLPE
jgi:methyl-accepting chemotaxis protein